MTSSSSSSGLLHSMLLSCGCRSPPRPESRVIVVNHIDPPMGEGIPLLSDYIYPGNEIITSRYTLWNFLPKNLFEQFQRIANFYFLLVAIIQLFIDSAVSPVTSIAPLIFVIAVSAVKQAYEDILRHRSDNEVNEKVFDVLDPKTGQFQHKRARNIHIGDIVCCHNQDGFPCDMVAIATSEESGQCYVTTASLDGETNLKVFSALPETKEYQTPEAWTAAGVRSVIQCQEPVDDLYSFAGKMWIQSSRVARACRPLSAENVLLRGAVLKNTDFCLGCAVYTGSDTKMALNSKGKRLKISQVENKLNFFLMVYFLLLLLMAVTSVGAEYGLRSQSWLQASWYIPTFDVTAWRVVQDFFNYIVLYNYVIPISLYVTIELQKFLGALFIGWDMEMYDAALDIRAKVNTSDLNEELGQVQFLFSDKTGTLTENEMKFRQCSIAGKKYVDVNGKLCERGPTESDLPKMLNDDWVLSTGGAAAVAMGEQKAAILEFFTVLSLCHTVRVDRSNEPAATTTGNGKKLTKDLGGTAGGGYENAAYDMEDGMAYQYQASSPDEKAFVEACRDYGLVFHGLMRGTHYVLTVGPPPGGAQSSRMSQQIAQQRQTSQYQLLQVLDFDSERKCMTVVLRYPDASIHVLCKGAETAMLNRNLRDRTSVDPGLIMEHVTDYANEGLRTLVIACKQISEAEYNEMSRKLDEARGSLNNREELVKQAYANFESNLRLIGCTAIEDRLQDGVPETIVQLRRAGIQVWILTGDKEETAVNISYSAGHFMNSGPNKTIEIRLTSCDSKRTVLRKIKNALEGISASPQSRGQHGLVVDGQTLKFALDLDIKPDFIQLCLSVNTVLCCRMTPLQKAEVVALIKQNVKPEPVTVAIGDGANDVSMIQEAHVGLGIYGKEGRQAVRSADYAFARFRHTRRLLLVHGHYFYTRLALLIQYFFYKNLVFVGAQFYFAIFSVFSAVSVYQSLYLMCYNLTYTSLPVLVFGIFEQILPNKMLYYQPELYKRNRGNYLLSWMQFFKWNLFGFWHSLVVYFSVHVFVYLDGNVSSPMGLDDDFYTMATVIFSCVWIVVTVKLLLQSHYINLIYFIAIVPITFGLNLALLFILTQFYLSFTVQILGVWVRNFSSGAYWLTVLFTSLLAIAPDVVGKFWEDYSLKQDIGTSLRKWKNAQKVNTVTGQLRGASSRTAPLPEPIGTISRTDGVDNIAYWGSSSSGIAPPQQQQQKTFSPRV